MRVHILYNGPPQKLPLWRIWTPSSAWSTTKTVSRSVKRFCRAHDCDGPIHRQTDRQADQQTTLLRLYSVTIGRIYVVLLVLWCALKEAVDVSGTKCIWRPAVMNEVAAVAQMSSRVHGYFVLWICTCYVDESHGVRWQLLAAVQRTLTTAQVSIV